MSELHRTGIVHRDLAARNVMLDKWLQAKVGDFGLAREGNEYIVEQIDQDGRQKRMELPWKWVAPEAATHRIFTQNSDVWAFGITMWEIFTLGGIPYAGLNNKIYFHYNSRCHFNLNNLKGILFDRILKVFCPLFPCMVMNSMLSSFGIMYFYTNSYSEPQPS